MSTTCLTTDDLQRFLAGQSPADQEQQVAAHLHDCPRCEALAAQLSDDAGARQYRAEFHRAERHASPPPDLSEMRERLHRLPAGASLAR